MDKNNPLRVWGIGANWGNKSMVKEFLEKGYAGIGWYEDDAPSLYAMMREIKSGDIIYIKSFVRKNCTLHIKAIGRVMTTKFLNSDYFIGKDRHISIQVEWFNDVELDDVVYEFNENIDKNNKKIDFRNNVYNNTLYREYSDKIISYINSLISDKKIDFW